MNSTPRQSLSRLILTSSLALTSMLAIAAGQATAQPMQQGTPTSERSGTVASGLPFGPQHVVGQEDTPLVISLLAPGAGPGVSATVKSLPPLGMLTQMDGTPITAAPAAVTDAQGRVVFIPESNVAGSPVTSFAYAVRDEARRATSTARQMFITLTPSNDLPTLALNTFGPLYEDTPQMLQLVASDPDMSWGGDQLEIKMLYPAAPIFGTLYQVGEDGVTLGEPIKINDVVTNSKGFIWLVPTNDFSGNSLNFLPKVTDRSGASKEVLYTLNLLPVNDPPVAFNVTVQGTDELSVFNAPVSMSDKDYWNANVSYLGVVLKTLPTRGTLYFNSVAPENMVTEANVGVPFPYYGTSLKYAPADGDVATPYDSYTFAATDLEYESDVKSVTINRVYKDKAPVFIPIEPQVMLEDGPPLEMHVQAINPDGPQSEVAYYVSSLPTKGTLKLYVPLTGKWVPAPIDNTWIWPSETPNMRYFPNPGVNTLESGPDLIQLLTVDKVSGHSTYMTVQVTIGAVNDAPVVGGADVAAARILLPLGLKVDAIINDFSVSDDSGDHIIGVTITSTNATSLTMLSVAELSNVQIGSTSISFEGTQAAINQALAAGVAFKPLNFSPGSVTLTVNDWGHTGPDGSSPSLTTSHTTMVIVTP